MSRGRGPTLSAGELRHVAVAVLVRPALWLVSLRQLRRLVAPGWWRRAPWLPLPPAEYVRFRLVTAYGSDGPDGPRDLARDLLAYLQWCRDSGW